MTEDQLQMLEEEAKAQRPATNAGKILRLIAELRKTRERLRWAEHALKYYGEEDRWESVSGEDCYVPNSFQAELGEEGFYKALIYFAKYSSEDSSSASPKGDG